MIRITSGFIFSILVCGRSMVAVAEDEAKESCAAHMPYIKGLTGKRESLKLWSCRPLNARWSKFEFRMIEGELKKDLIESLAKSVFSKDAGMFITLDIPFELADSRGQGLLVIQDEERNQPLGLSFRAIMENKRALQFKDVTAFDPENEQISYNHRHDLAGVILKIDFRSAIAGASNGEPGAEQDKRMQNKAEMATPRKPSD